MELARNISGVHVVGDDCPISLNNAQEDLVKKWADDRLWRTHESREINLRTFARAVLARWEPDQCAAMTPARWYKAASRCSHSALAGSRFCGKHQPKP